MSGFDFGPLISTEWATSFSTSLGPLQTVIYEFRYLVDVYSSTTVTVGSTDSAIVTLATPSSTSSVATIPTINGTISFTFLTTSSAFLTTSTIPRPSSSSPTSQTPTPTPRPEPVPGGTIATAVIVPVLVISLLVGLFFWFRNRKPRNTVAVAAGGDGDTALIGLSLWLRRRKQSNHAEAAADAAPDYVVTTEPELRSVRPNLGAAIQDVKIWIRRPKNAFFGGKRNSTAPQGQGTRGVVPSADVEKRAEADGNPISELAGKPVDRAAITVDPAPGVIGLSTGPEIKSTVPAGAPNPAESDLVPTANQPEQSEDLLIDLDSESATNEASPPPSISASSSTTPVLGRLAQLQEHRARIQARRERLLQLEELDREEARVNREIEEEQDGEV